MIHVLYILAPRLLRFLTARASFSTSDVSKGMSEIPSHPLGFASAGVIWEAHSHSLNVQLGHASGILPLLVMLLLR